MADKFIADGGIVSTRGRSEQENFNYRAHRPGTWWCPARGVHRRRHFSASEIFAGAIKDWGRGTIVGTRSYGKGSVQGIFPLGKSGAGTRLTTAKFYSPSGRAISNVGVTPDIDFHRARRRWLLGGQTSTLVGFRGTNNIGAPMATNSAATGGNTTASVPKSPEKDRAVPIAVGVVRELPVAAL